MQQQYLLYRITGLLTLCLITISWGAKAQVIEKKVNSFDRIIISPRINVKLVKGTQEKVKIETNGLGADKINIKVSGKTLRIYLDQARIQEKRIRVNNYNGWDEKISIYEGREVDAIITFRDLKHLQIRGNQTVDCEEPLIADKFKLKLYGETRIKLASLSTDRLKASLFGQNKVLIKGGEASKQIVKLFGENTFNTRRVTSKVAKANSFGVSDVYLNTTDWLKVSAFGESNIFYAGGATLHTGLVLGENQINRIK